MHTRRFITFYEQLLDIIWELYLYESILHKFARAWIVWEFIEYKASIDTVWFILILTVKYFTKLFKKIVSIKRLCSLIFFI